MTTNIWVSMPFAKALSRVLAALDDLGCLRICAAK